ncbi:MAG: hypothetical protein C0417_07300 [Chlorobiaceae bacterium]|nr:hypothetical protein [Chlorobiaceae bacterium]
MNMIELIGLIQAVVLFVTAIIIAWYTYETQKIRKETSKQNTLLSEQLLIMQRSHEHALTKEQFESQREKSFIQPLFRFEGGQHSTQSAKLRFINKGGPAKKLKVIPIDNFIVSIRPATIIGTDEKGEIELSASDLRTQDRFNFEIEYQDKLDKIYKKKFYFQHQTGHMHEDDNGA